MELTHANNTRTGGNLRGARALRRSCRPTRTTVHTSDEPGNMVHPWARPAALTCGYAGYRDAKQELSLVLPGPSGRPSKSAEPLQIPPTPHTSPTPPPVLTLFGCLCGFDLRLVSGPLVGVGGCGTGTRMVMVPLWGGPRRHLVGPPTCPSTCVSTPRWPTGSTTIEGACLGRRFSGGWYVTGRPQNTGTGKAIELVLALLAGNKTAAKKGDQNATQNAGHLREMRTTQNKEVHPESTRTKDRGTENHGQENHRQESREETDPKGETTVGGDQEGHQESRL